MISDAPSAQRSTERRSGLDIDKPHRHIDTGVFFMIIQCTSTISNVARTVHVRMVAAFCVGFIFRGLGIDMTSMSLV